MDAEDLPEWLPWQPAWQQALYGERGFYRRPEGPAGHFRTASHAAGPELAAALAGLAARHGRRSILDVGAGRGELLTALHAVAPHLRLHGVDVVDRPRGLPDPIAWSNGLDAVPRAAAAGGLVVAWELLDVVPCPVLEVDDDGSLREVEVCLRSGEERLAAPPQPADAAWTRRWWPLERADPGERVEVGRTRDALWRRIVELGSDSTCLLVDYGSLTPARPPLGSLSAFRAGRQVPPVPDGSCDLTAEVAVDSAADAGLRAGATTVELTTQARALEALGLEALGGRAADLLDPGGLGSFLWLVQTVPETVA